MLQVFTSLFMFEVFISLLNKKKQKTNINKLPRVAEYSLDAQQGELLRFPKEDGSLCKRLGPVCPMVKACLTQTTVEAAKVAAAV
jgi:hypothetical protein